MSDENQASSSWRGEISLFSGSTRTRPTRMLKSLNWMQLADTLAPQMPLMRMDKGELDYFVPCLLRDDVPLIGKTLKRATDRGEPTIGAMRSAAHVTAATWMVFDFDSYPKDRIREGFKPFLGNGRAGVLYTTHSHEREGTTGARLRLILPVDMRLDSNAYREAHELMNERLFGSQADRTGKALCQQQAVFGVHPDRAGRARRWVHEGQVFELTAFLTEHEGKRERSARKRAVAKPLSPREEPRLDPRPAREELPSLGRIEVAVPLLQARSYTAWASGLIALKALAPYYPDGEIREIAIRFSGTSPDDSTRRQAIDDPRYDPEEVFDKAQPVMPPGAAAGVILGQARDRAVELFTIARATHKVSPAAQYAANYLAAFHQRRWGELNTAQATQGDTNE